MFDLICALVLAPILLPLAVWLGHVWYWWFRRVQNGSSYGRFVFTERELALIHLAEDSLLATYPKRRNL